MNFYLLFFFIFSIHLVVTNPSHSVYIQAILRFLGPGWLHRNGCGSLQMRVVAVLSGSKRFIRLVLRLEISVFAGYLRLVNHRIQHR